MKTIPNREAPLAGAKYRACPWYSISSAPSLVGYGLEEKQLYQSRYSPVAWRGQAYPFETRRAIVRAAAKIGAAAQKGKP